MRSHGGCCRSTEFFAGRPVQFARDDAACAHFLISKSLLTARGSIPSRGMCSEFSMAYRERVRLGGISRRSDEARNPDRRYFVDALRSFGCRQLSSTIAADLLPDYARTAAASS